ncbi:MAG: TIGR02147 family protein [Bdellovibrionia bacterium]
MSAVVITKNPNTDQNRPEIYAYQDYKVFLRDLFHFMKISDVGFSLRRLATKAEISVGYLPTLMNTRRDITPKIIEKLLPHLGLDRTESAYFRILCTITESSTQEERIEALKKLQRFEKYSTLNPNEVLVSNYFSKWYYVVIREMANEPGFKPDPIWVQERLAFAVPLAEVAKTLEFLFKNQLIKFNPNGSFSSSGGHVACQGRIFRFILTHYYKQTFELAATAIDTVEREHRNMRSQTACLSPGQFQQAKKIMDQALEEIIKISGNHQPESSVYHFSSFAFPVSKPKGVKE